MSDIPDHLPKHLPRMTPAEFEQEVCALVTRSGLYTAAAVGVLQCVQFKMLASATGLFIDLDDDDDEEPPQDDRANRREPPPINER